jgi:hypothetical protein
VGEWSVFKLGDHVRISLRYSEQLLWGQTGQIVGLPDEEDDYEYLIILDGGFFTSPALANRKVLIASKYIDFA